MYTTCSGKQLSIRLFCKLAFSIFSILIMRVPVIAQADSTRTKAKVIPDTLLFRLEKVQAAIVQINAANKKGYNLGKIRQELAGTRSSILLIKKALNVANPLPQTKDLVNYRLMLADIQKNTAGWRKSLSTYNTSLQAMSEQIIQYSGDSLLTIVDNDTTQRTLYAAQIKDLKSRLQQSGETTVAHLDSVSRLLADASALYFSSTDLQNTVNDYLKDSDKNLLGQETQFIWSAPLRDKSQNMTKMIQASYSGQDKILRYFFNSNWDNRLLLIAFVIGFFLWVHINYRLIKKRNITNLVGPLDFKIISPIPILASLVVLFNLTPLFEPHSPSIYIELNQFFLLVTLSILFAKGLPKSQVRWWIVLIFLYVLTVLFNIIVNESLILRLALALLSVASFYLGYRLFRRTTSSGMEEAYIKPVLIIHMVLAGLSVFLNIFGRLSLAKSFNLTGVSGVIEIISLAVLIRVFTEALELHIKVSSCSEGIFSRINIKRSNASARKGLLFLCAWLWILVFMINLNILDPIMGFVQQILTRDRTFGSISFTFGNILFFVIIVFLANQLQKNIGIFFGEEDVDFTGDKVQKGSKLALIRLVIIVMVLFAVSASGVPLTKITVLLGALGVGIGLGLQNIINNFVSGIILIFEKPFNIGDYIELADKKGKVLEIGIRSSKMLTQQGSRVIIPNGDLLSGRLVNFTQHDSHLKSELTFKVNIDADVNLVKKLVNDTIGKGEGVVKKAPRQILFNAITGDSMEFKILVWLNDVYIEPVFKSFFLENIHQKFKENGIKLM
jgi:potassium efflux system protein